MKIDLHVHTYFSDGTHSPTEVVDMAVKEGVKYLAICDHDVITGVNEAISSSEGKDIKVIPGIEITSKVACSEKEVHIVGLYLDTNNKALNDFSEDIQSFKINRTKKKIAKLNDVLDSDITLEDLRQKTKGVPSSAHIWMVLIDKGKAKDIKEARDLAIKNGTIPEDSIKKRVHAKEAIKMIHNAGGIAILAHLAAYKNEGKFVTHPEQEELIKELKSYKIDGLEIYIPMISEEDLEFGKSMAKKYALKLSCGSDFHDEVFIPQNKIGFLDIDKNLIGVLRD